MFGHSIHKILACSGFSRHVFACIQRNWPHGTVQIHGKSNGAGKSITDFQTNYNFNNGNNTAAKSRFNGKDFNRYTNRHWPVFNIYIRFCSDCRPVQLREYAIKLGTNLILICCLVHRFDCIFRCKREITLSLSLFEFIFMPFSLFACNLFKQDNIQANHQNNCHYQVYSSSSIQCIGSYVRVYLETDWIAFINKYI